MAAPFPGQPEFGVGIEAPTFSDLLQALTPLSPPPAPKLAEACGTRVAPPSVQFCFLPFSFTGADP